MQLLKLLYTGVARNRKIDNLKLAWYELATGMERTQLEACTHALDNAIVYLRTL